MKLWEVATGKCIRTVQAPDIEEILVACFSPDRKKVILTDNGRSMKLWDVEKWKCVHEFDEISFELVFSPDGKTALIEAGSYELNTFQLWSIP